MNSDTTSTLFLIFPFGFLIDGSTSIVKKGRSLNKIFNSEIENLKIDQVFENFNQKLDIELNKIYILKSKFAKIRIRGQFLKVNNYFFYTGSISASDTNDLLKYGLTFQDFSVQDPIFDFMMTLASEKHSAKKLAESLDLLKYKNFLNEEMQSFAVSINESEDVDTVIEYLIKSLFKTLEIENIIEVKNTNSADNFDESIIHHNIKSEIKSEPYNAKIEFLSNYQNILNGSTKFSFNETAYQFKISNHNFNQIFSFNYNSDTVYTETMKLYLVVMLQITQIKIDNIISTNERIALVQMQAHSGRMNLLGEMSAGIAHEINSPLAVIHAKSNKLKNLILDSKTTSANSLDTELILKSVDRITKVIKGLRKFSRDGRTDPLEVCPINQIIQDSLILCETKIKNKNIDIIIKIEPEDLMVKCRTIEISQILTNLISNSIDAIESLENKFIQINCYSDNLNFYLEVIDSGNRIPQNIREKLMTPFFTTKEPGKGTGLGLSISHTIAKEHGGELFIKDSKNTCFCLKLPLNSNKR